MCEKSYLIKAFYQWARDNNHTIEILLWIKHHSFNSNIPKKYLKEENLVFNISKKEVKRLEIEKDKIEFNVSGKGKSYKLSIDIDAIYWLRDKEAGEYLRLDDDDKPYIKGVFTNVREEENIEKKIKNRRIGMAPEAIEKWIRKNFDKYTTMLHINDWAIAYQIIAQNHPESIENDGRIAADCDTRYQYKSATIRLFATQIHSVKSLRRILIHELAHVAMACVKLYTKFFEKIDKCSDSEKEIAKRVSRDVRELLAVKIETIIAGQKKDTVRIYKRASEVDEMFRRDCQEASLFNSPRISKGKARRGKRR